MKKTPEKEHGFLKRKRGTPYELTRGPVHKIRHECSKPSFFSRLFNGIKSGDLWRCHDCGRVWRWYVNDVVKRPIPYLDAYWEEVTKEDWIEAGGVTK